MEIVLDTEPSEADHDAIRDALAAYNAINVVEASVRTPVALLLKNDQDRTIGGLWGLNAYRWLYVQLLFVPETLHGEGLGTGLMEMAEEYATTQNLTGIWLDTFSFQAQAFYEKIGYSVFGTLDDCPPGLERHFLCKRLA